MRQAKRQRRYVSQHWLMLMRPVFRFSESRNAFVLRGVGRHMGPVLRIERRSRQSVRSADRRTRIA